MVSSFDRAAESDAVDEITRRLELANKAAEHRAPSKDPFADPEELTIRAALTQALDSHDNARLNEIRASFDQERQKAQAFEPVSPESLAEVESFLRTASNEERDAFLINIESLSTEYPEIDARLAELDKEIGNIPDNSGFLANTWGSIVDSGGNVIGKGLDALAWPADKLEQVMGLSYFDELPMAQRWELARLTYESGANNLFGDGTAKDRILADVFTMQMADPKRDFGSIVDELEDRYSNAWADGLTKVALDPLWLVGGVGFFAKALPAGVRVTRAGQAIEHGVVDFSRIPGLRNIKGVRGIGRRTDARLMDDALRQAGLSSAPDMSAYHNTRTGFFRRFFNILPQGRVDNDLDAVQSTFMSFRDSAMWVPGGDGALRVKSNIVSILDGRAPEQLAGATSAPIRRMHEMSTEIQDLNDLFRGNQFQAFRTEIDKVTDFGKRARAMLGAQEDGAALVAALDSPNGVAALNQTQRETYALVRTQLAMEELWSKVVPILTNHHAGQTPQDIIHAADKFSAGMKRWISMVTLNNPKFVVLNYTSNAFHVLTKLQAPGAAADFLTHAFGGASPRLLAREAALGLSDPLADSAVMAGGLARDLGAVTGEAGTQRPLYKRAMDVFERVAGKLDFSFGKQGYIEGSHRITPSIWHAGADGIQPQITDPILQQLDILPGWLDSLAYKTPDSVDAWFRELEAAAHSDRLITAEGLLNGFMKGEWAEHSAQQLTDGVQTAVNNERLLAQALVPQSLVEQTQAMIDRAITARAAGSAEWLGGFHRDVELLTDDTAMSVFEKLIHSGEAPPTIPTSRVIDSIAPWQLRAQFQLHWRRSSEMVQQIIARDAVTQGAPARARIVANRAAKQYKELTDAVDDSLKQIRAIQSSDSGSYTILRSTLLDVAKQVEATHQEIHRTFANNLMIRAQLENMFEIERNNVRRWSAQLMVGASDNTATRFPAAAVPTPGVPTPPGTPTARSMLRGNAAITDAASYTGDKTSRLTEKILDTPISELSNDDLVSLAIYSDSAVLSSGSNISSSGRRISDAVTEEARRRGGYIDYARGKQSFVSTESAHTGPTVATQVTDTGEAGIELSRNFATHMRRVLVSQNREDTLVRQAARLPGMTSGNIGGQIPNAGRAFQTQAESALRYMDYVKANFNTVVAGSKSLTPEQLTALRGFIPEVKASMRQLNHIQDIAGRVYRDHTALNYSQKNGIDAMIGVLYPYHFWISRTMHSWMKMTMSMPGQAAAYVKLYDMVAEINEDAGIPARLKNSIRFPVPGLSNIPGMEGSGNSLFFDPLKMMFPFASFQNEIDFNRGIERTALGRAWDASQQFTVGNPFATLGLGASGLLGDRDTYTRRSINFPNLPGGLPGPRATRAVWDWMSGTTEPDRNVLSDDDIQRTLNGEPWSEPSLKSLFQPVLDFATTDGFDEFRVDRAISSLVGMNPERWSQREALLALRDRRGPLYEAAKQFAQTEKGLAALTGWAFMPMRLYPEGEEMQRGMDAIYRAARDEGGDALDEFFGKHPEYRVRQIQLTDNEDGQRDREIDTSLFYIDVAVVDDKYDDEIEQLRDFKADAERRGFLESKEGRRQLSIIDNDLDILYAMKEEDIAKLEALYPDRLTELSLRAAPRERALFNARTEYFDLKRSDFATADEYFAAREAIVTKYIDGEQDPVQGMQAAIESVVISSRYSAMIAANPDRRDSLISERDQKLRALTNQAAGFITRDEFLTYVNANRRAPTPERLEYTEAKNDLTEYFAIDEAPGLTTRQRTEYKREYWTNHPLLTKYFGNSEPRAWSAESAAIFGRMTQIWDGWFDRQQDPYGAKLYLNNVLPELNELRIQVGLYPLRLIDPLEEPDFNQVPTDPHEAALLNEQE